MSENEKKDDAFLEDDFNEDFGDLQGDNSQKKKRMMVLLLVLILSGGAFFFLTSEDDEGFDPFVMSEEIITPKRVHKSDKTIVKKENDGKEKKKPRNKRSKKTKEKAIAGANSEAVASEGPPKRVSKFGSIALTAPFNGATRNYDLTSDRPVFNWNGNAESILFSKNATMRPLHFRSAVSGNTFTGKHLEPGTWYWQVVNSDGGSEVFSFNIKPSVGPTPEIIQPTNGAVLSQDGALVSWSQLEKAAYYRVQLTEGETWLQPPYMFSTSGSEATLNGVAPGSYKMRIGGFSEHSGRWVYSDSISVEIQ